MNHLTIVGVSLLALTALPAFAQEDCADDHVCVDYEGQVLEIDPDDGFLQSIVVEERTLTTKGFDGTMTEAQVKVATFIQDGDTYRLRSEDVAPQSGIFEDAELGDSYRLEKAN